ncbi:YihY/virulence factor BrkB family protein [Enterococcus asini]|uniref:YihY/virulence factor BrkB family protein n=1 Tax=Enterococcus asini TaxID=57732 RepID=UPI0028906222|nr:YihY/virulence factor BrkB family protein [Enterococcus asini]MDT2756455.1 YihY/virulence factor BrkB family protein [Enterococcus asini]
MNWLRKIRQNEELKTLLTISKQRFSDAELGNSSVVVAYYLLLSLFPLLIAVGNLLPFFQIDPNSILPYLKNVMPGEIYTFLGPAIHSLLTQGSGGLLSISALAAVWSASKSINALQGAMNKAYGVDNRDNFIVVRIVSVLILLLLLAGGLSATLVLGVGKAVLDALQPIFGFSGDIINTFQTFKWPATILALLLIMTVIYWLVPNAQVRFVSAFPGAVVATLGWLLLGQLFGLYTRFFAAKVSGYQIIGSFIVLMIWLNLAAGITLFGGIINAIIATYRSGGNVEKRHGPITRITSKLRTRIKQKVSSKED